MNDVKFIPPCAVLLVGTTDGDGDGDDDAGMLSARQTWWQVTERWCNRLAMARQQRAHRAGRRTCQRQRPSLVTTTLAACRSTLFTGRLRTLQCDVVTYCRLPRAPTPTDRDGLRLSTDDVIDELWWRHGDVLPTLRVEACIDLMRWSVCVNIAVTSSLTSYRYAYFGHRQVKFQFFDTAFSTQIARLFTIFFH